MQVSSGPDPELNIMSETILVVGILAVLLALEWRYRRRRLRVATALLALAVLFFYQPS